jgi:hypothetical protein
MKKDLQRPSLLAFVLLCLVVYHVSAIASTAFASVPFVQSTDKPSVHGMLIFGGIVDTPLYASHLPMFHSPHNYQVLLEIKLPDSIHTLYKASVQKHPRETVYTIEPEVFILPDMVQKPRPFKVHLYRGHFERGGTKIAENITAVITSVLHFRKFDPMQQRPNTAEYLLFGTVKQPFLVHAIAAKPDFDQVLALKPQTPVQTLLADKNAPITAVTIIGVKNIPLKNSQSLQIRSNTSKEAASKAVRASVVKSLYCEFDDLK